MSVLSDVGDLGALQFVLTHLGRSGGVIGGKADADCVPLVDALFTSNNLANKPSLNAGFISLSGMPTPGEFMRCSFRTSERLGPGDFEVTVTDASDPSLLPKIPPPQMAVTSVIAR